MPERVIRFDTYEVNFHRRELRKCGVKVSLQQKPFRVLELLLRHPGDLVSREELIGFLWPDSHVSFAHGLNTAVNSLRQALGESSRKRAFIETRPGLGYRFNAPVTEVSGASLQSGSPNATGNRGGVHEDCLKGRYFLDRLTAEDTYKAMAFFKSAMTDEPSCSLAHVGIADAYSQLALLGSINSADLAHQAQSAVAIALSHDPDLPHAHVSAARVAMIFDKNAQAAQEAISRALTRDPGLVSAHLLHASLLLTLGRYQESLPICRQALYLDPLSLPANLQLAACLYAARDFKQVIHQCWNILTLTPQFAPAQLLLTLAYQHLGLHEDAAVEFTNARRSAGCKEGATHSLFHLLALTGLSIEAEAALLQDALILS